MRLGAHTETYVHARRRTNRVDRVVATSDRTVFASQRGTVVGAASAPERSADTLTRVRACELRRGYAHAVRMPPQPARKKLKA
jgi:hypothetical protein